MTHCFKITVEKCIDVDCWVWSLVAYDGGVFADGYADTEDDAWIAAREARQEREAELTE